MSWASYHCVFCLLRVYSYNCYRPLFAWHKWAEEFQLAREEVTICICFMQMRLPSKWLLCFLWVVACGVGKLILRLLFHLAAPIECVPLTDAKAKTTRSKYESTKRYYTNKSIHTLADVQLYEGGSTKKKGLNDRCSMKSESWHAPTGWSISAWPIFEPQSLRVWKIIQFLGKRARGKSVLSLGEPFKAFAGKWKLQRLTLSARILRGNCQSCTRSTCRSCRLSRRRRPRTWSAVPKTWFLTQKTQQIRRLPTQNVEQATMFSLRP